MITIKVVHVAKSEQETEEFFKSLSYSHSTENPFEIIKDGEDKNPSDDSVIEITLPDDCIVLGNAWDKYIMHAVNNGLPQYGRGKNYVPNWENYVQAKMGLQTRRPPEGIFPDLKVALSTQ